jgi:ubiquinol-cytochrome c reductase cytochrome b subunit
MTIRIVNGGNDMPAYGGILTKSELNSIVAFLETRKVK